MLSDAMCRVECRHHGLGFTFIAMIMCQKLCYIFDLNLRPFDLHIPLPVPAHVVNLFYLQGAVSGTNYL